MSAPESSPPADSAATNDASRIYAVFQVLARVEDQLRFADSKAAFVATLHAFLIGPLAANVGGLRAVVASWDPTAHLVLALCVGAYAVLFLISMGLVAMTVLPRSRATGRPASRVFFGRIAREFADQPHRFAAALARMNDEDWLAEVGQYIVDASAIAAVKHAMARRATIFAVPTVAAWLMVVVVLVIGGRL